MFIHGVSVLPIRLIYQENAERTISNRNPRTGLDDLSMDHRGRQGAISAGKGTRQAQPPLLGSSSTRHVQSRHRAQSICRNVRTWHDCRRPSFWSSAAPAVISVGGGFFEYFAGG
jgi:hypothetical protein